MWFNFESYVSEGQNNFDFHQYFFFCLNNLVFGPSLKYFRVWLNSSSGLFVLKIDIRYYQMTVSRQHLNKVGKEFHSQAVEI